MNQQADDDIAREPDWQEWLEERDHYCWAYDGLLTYDSYDPINKLLTVHCAECRETDKISTEPDYDRD